MRIRSDQIQSRICLFQVTRSSLHQDLHHPLLLLAVQQQVFLHHQHCHTPNTPWGCLFPMEPHQQLPTQLTCLQSSLPATTHTLWHHILNKVSPTPSSSVFCPESQTLSPVPFYMPYVFLKCSVSGKGKQCPITLT
jgi:hypothetical protein